MNLEPHETDLRGSWVQRGEAGEGDLVWHRIEHLARSVLRKVAVARDGWEVLFVDEADGRYWELTYPESGSHGGGPPRLTVLGRDEVSAKYPDVVG